MPHPSPRPWSPSSRLRWAVTFRLLVHPFPPAWTAGALAWLVISAMVLLAVGRVADLPHVVDGWRLTSLFWGQLGLAGVVVALIKGERQRIPLLLMLVLIPPILLYGLLQLMGNG